MFDGIGPRRVAGDGGGEEGEGQGEGEEAEGEGRGGMGLGVRRRRSGNSGGERGRGLLRRRGGGHGGGGHLHHPAAAHRSSLGLRRRVWGASIHYRRRASPLGFLLLDRNGARSLSLFYAIVPLSSFLYI